MCLHVLRVGGGQSAKCVSLFPVPLTRLGFFPHSLIDFTACVPPEACPGVDSEAVRTVMEKNSSVVFSTYWQRAPVVFNVSDAVVLSEATNADLRSDMLGLLDVAQRTCDAGEGCGAVVG